MLGGVWKNNETLIKNDKIVEKEININHGSVLEGHDFLSKK